jgi:membrane associated rhomboid family serine protease/Flp pilus assembly protein TadD
MMKSAASWIHPEGYVGRRYYPVFATYVIFALNVLIFILMTLAGGSTKDSVLLTFGASYAPLFHLGEYWRLVMPMFLHIGWMHLATNMAGLILLGCFLEPLYGYGRFSLLYVASGIAGSLLSMEASPHVIAAGASGAIFGIAGAMLVTGLLHPSAVPRRWKPVFGLGITLVIAINLVFGHFAKHIDNWAHLGGLLAGSVLALIMPPVRLPGGEGPWSAKGFQVSLLLPVCVVALSIGATTRHYFKSGEVASLLRAAARLERGHHPRRALALALQAHHIEPNDLSTSEILGTLYLAEHQYAQAARQFRQVLRFDPGSTPDIALLASALEAQGQAAEAREILETAESKSPHDTGILESLAEVCTELKQYSEAIRRYKELLKLQPNAWLAQNNLAWLYATCPDPRFRDPSGALRYAVRAVRLTGGRVPDFVDTLAAAFYVNAKFQLAAATEERAVQLDPHNSSFRATLLRYEKAAEKEAGR